MDTDGHAEARTPLLPHRQSSSRLTDAENDNTITDCERGAESASSSGISQARATWRRTAARIVQANRVQGAIGEALERHEPGAAPGIDPRRSIYQHLAAKWCLPATVTVVDFDAQSIDVRSGLQGVGPLRDVLSAPRPRSARARWIHVDGLNWEVIQLLALTYDLHPLALEDTVHVPQRIKADLYDCCLYVSLIYLYLASAAGVALPHAHDSHAHSHGHAGFHDAHTHTPGHAQTHSHSHGHGHTHVHAPGHSHGHDCGHGHSHSATVDGAATAAGSAARGILSPTISSVQRAVGVGTAAAATAAATAAAAIPDDADANGGGGVRRRRVSSPGPSHYPLPLHHGASLSSARGGGSGGSGGSGATAAAVRGRAATSLTSAAAAAGGGGDGGAAAIHVSAQQVSLFLLRGEHANTLITVFQSDGSAVTRPILAQLREPRTLVREAEDASFLANLVIDTLVDHIFPVVGAYREQLQRYEADVTGGGLPSAASTRELHAMQRDLRRIDRTIAPLQAVVSNMVARDATAVDSALAAAAAGRRLSDADGTPLTHGSRLALASAPFLSRLTRTYLGDVRDHVATICEDLMSLSAECGDLIGLIFNLATHRQSQSTQTLAVVSTIFLPITFLAGVYGMNFDSLPELHWPYGYAYFWAASVSIVLVFMWVMLRAGLWSW